MKRFAKRLPFLALALAFLAQTQPSPPPAKTSLAVYPIKPAGVPADLTTAMTALLTARLTPSPRLKVIEEAMLKTVMERQGLNASDACDDTSCQVDIGKLVKAQKMVTGTLSKIGSKYFLSTNLVDIQTGAAEFSTEDKCSCSEDQLEDLIAVAVVKIRNHFGENLPLLALPSASASPPVPTGASNPAGSPLPPPAAVPQGMATLYLMYQQSGCIGGGYFLLAGEKVKLRKRECVKKVVQSGAQIVGVEGAPTSRFRPCPAGITISRAPAVARTAPVTLKWSNCPRPRPQPRLQLARIFLSYKTSSQ